MKEYIGGVIEGSDAYMLLKHLQGKSNSLLVITNTLQEETKLLADFAFYLQSHQDYKHIEVLHFAHYEVLFYDSSSPAEHIISNRIKTLYKLLHTKRQYIVVVSLETLLSRLCPVEFIRRSYIDLKVGGVLDITQFSEQLTQAGYFRTQQVNSPLDFAVRGSLIDIYPAGRTHPLRIDLFDNEISEIRVFDAEAQTSLKTLTHFSILSAKEFDFNSESRKMFLAQHRSLIGKEDEIFRKVEQATLPSGIESYLPLFFKELSSLFDYIPGDTLVNYKRGLSEQVDNTLTAVENSYQEATHNLDRIPLAPEHIVLAKNEFFEQLNNFPQLVYDTYNIEKHSNVGVGKLPSLVIHNHSLALIKNFLHTTQKRVLIVCAAHSRMSILLESLSEYHLHTVAHFYEFLHSPHSLCITIGEISAGFSTNEWNIVPEQAIFGNVLSKQTRKRRAKHKDFSEGVHSLIELSEGDMVVHESYGIGRYLGLKTLEMDGVAQDLVQLEYEDGAKLMIPTTEINLISPYVGSNNPSLNKLGTKQWSNAKAKVLKELRDLASELLALYAKRTVVKGYGISQHGIEYENFVAGFPFVATEDQERATTEVIADLASETPMDRLICGDVGFGKTEVAMRAAFIVAAAGYQVAILTPTTLLASQHYQSFVERFDGFAFNIAELSRFKSAPEQKEIKEKLRSGGVDIVIGTHKLLQKNMEYKNLGLVIIDEEHRFGVKQKESLKEIKNTCNILSMSATPIPRTLSLALNDLRSMSVIATPPLGRTKVHTFVKLFDKHIITEAISREIHRGGQVFFVHNDIDTIDKIADTLNEFFPRLNIRIAHGRMHAMELEKIMSDFYHQRFEILVCTTIIETGIDVPTANTIIINNANNFGLSQLHQLRGRVGRSHHQAYAYLLIKSWSFISENAEKRLEAIAHLEEVGAGFNLATHDLEIRGAGDILGKNQSGKISEIGYSLYYDLLKRTIKSIKNNENIAEATTHDVTINLGISALIPSSYVFDVHTRLEFYARMKEAEDLDEVRYELIDRFGLLPNETKNLFASYELRTMCESLGVSEVNAFEDRVLLSFDEKAKVDFGKIIKLIQTRPQEYKLKNNNTLIYFYSDLDDLERISTIKTLLNNLK